MAPSAPRLITHHCVRAPGRPSTNRACCSAPASPVTASASSSVMHTQSATDRMASSAALRSPSLKVQERGPAAPAGQAAGVEQVRRELYSHDSRPPLTLQYTDATAAR